MNVIQALTELYYLMDDIGSDTEKEAFKIIEKYVKDKENQPIIEDQQ